MGNCKLTPFPKLPVKVWGQVMAVPICVSDLTMVTIKWYT